MILQEAHKIALDVMYQLRPFCERLEIAGSVRREKAEPRDIEIVAIPKPWQTGMFMDGIAEVCSQWVCVKGRVEDENDVKYTQRSLPQGIKLDLFFADKINWGWILALRTGSSNFNFTYLEKLKERRMFSKDGYIHNASGNVHAVLEEEDFFRLLNMEYVHPRDRI